MKEKQFAVPAYTTAEEIRAVRKELDLSQQEFARLLGCSKPTVVRMEASEDPITGPVVLAVYALKEDALKRKIVLPDMKYRLRLTYIFRQSICTIIEVDEMNEKVEIINYDSNIMFQAFGANKKPTFEDYKDFLESRCFPQTRDKMKIQLELLDLPFYDPLMIIEKTAGRMAEDEFWLKIERK